MYSVKKSISTLIKITKLVRIGRFLIQWMLLWCPVWLWEILLEQIYPDCWQHSKISYLLRQMSTQKLMWLRALEPFHLQACSHNFFPVGDFTVYLYPSTYFPVILFIWDNTSVLYFCIVWHSWYIFLTCTYICIYIYTPRLELC